MLLPRMLLLTGFLAVRTSAAQPPAVTAKPLHPAVLAYEIVKKRMTALADSMPSDGYATRMSKDMKSFDEAISHVVDTNFGVCSAVRKEARPKGDLAEGVVSGKPELQALLRASFEFCDPVFASLTPQTVASSEVTFVTSHAAQNSVLLEAYLVIRGYRMQGYEAVRKSPARK